MTNTDHEIAADTAGHLALERPISRGDRVRDALQNAILDGTLAQGTPLVERDLSVRLGVSKTPIREALKQLQSSGLVVPNSYSGMTVRTLDASTVNDVTGARLVVEPQAIGQAVRRRGAVPHIAGRRALLDAQAALEAGQAVQLSLANRAFHRSLYSESANALLTDFLDKLQVLSTFIATAGWRGEATYDSEAAEHAAILECFESGDAEATETLIREHIVRSAEVVLRALELGE